MITYDFRGQMSKAHARWLPKKLYIRGQEHMVVCVDYLRDQEDAPAWGFYDGGNNVIIISKETPPAARGMVLLHEIIHGLSLIDNLQLDGDEKGEQVVRLLGNGINECIMSNRKAWDKIWKASSRFNRYETVLS